MRVDGKFPSSYKDGWSVHDYVAEFEFKALLRHLPSGAPNRATNVVLQNTKWPFTGWVSLKYPNLQPTPCSNLWISENISFEFMVILASWVFLFVKNSDSSELEELDPSFNISGIAVLVMHLVLRVRSCSLIIVLFLLVLTIMYAHNGSIQALH